MLKFTSIDPKNPEKISPNVRSNHFKEIYAKFAREKAEEQSSRCAKLLSKSLTNRS